MSVRGRLPELRFNPILVQFKRTLVSAAGHTTARFQSYLSPIQTRKTKDVTVEYSKFQSYLSPIQTVDRPDDVKRPLKFQSYLSPIQTDRHHHCPDRPAGGFNPILVQFKLNRRT